MSENKKQPLVPRLRFPDFCDDQSWSFQPLGRLARRSTKKNTEGDITRVLTNSAEYGVIDQRDFFDKDIANQGNLESYYIVEEGDYVYNPRISATAPVGPVSKNRIGLGVMSPLYTVFRFNNTQNDIYAHYFKSTHWHHYMRQASSTGARHDRMSITNDDFMGLPLPVSKPEEQQKIADCLSSLDDLIVAETQKLDTLKTHKKGLMQQLFPREGETVPQLRFPEFREAGEWRKEKLGTIANLYKGKGISKADIVPKGAQPCIRYGELYTIYGEVIHNVASSTNVNARDLFLSKKHDVIIPASGETKIDIAKASCVMHDDIALGGDLNVIRSSQNGIFLSYQLNGPLRLTIARVAQGDTVVHLYPTQIEQLDVLFPTPDEQQRIADFLSSIDDLITVQSQKIDALKTHKKGLMQQLFPTLDEVDA